ncbi:MAG TPA: translation initiation factor IF-2 [Acidimicrobiia bacterium]|nr:translation initiation factor IF-2 [Acidimicrobiia bacterium]
MAKVRVYELARELGIESTEVLEQAQALGVEAKTASSSIADSDADLIRLGVSESKAPAGEAEAEPAPVPEPAPEPVAEPVPAPPMEKEIRVVPVKEGATVAEVAEALGESPAALIKALMDRGVLVGIGAPLPAEHLEAVAESFGAMVDLQKPVEAAPTPRVRRRFEDAEADLLPRPPIVTVMGHVDHGKTTLLDTIRKTSVVSGEQGGITQHIGAYQVEVGGRLITFIDTPGHEAFTALRARGADITDIVVLVVAANDGVMPQTIEAISHSRAANVKLVVAINKVDLPGVDPFRVRTMLTEYGVVTEDLGGDVPVVELSALTGQGVDNLLEILDLIAQLEDFRANPQPAASGVVIESQLDPGMGPTATVIIQRGTLHNGDAFVAGAAAGRVRAMMDYAGTRIKTAGPSTPVLVMGWSEIPTAGDPFEAVATDREARTLAADRLQIQRDAALAGPANARERLASLLEQLRADEAELRLIIKADAHGSLEALRESITKIKREGGRIEIMHGAVGGINENDVKLAEVTEAVIVGFNVRPDGKTRRLAEEKAIEIRTYGIIYELLEELEQMLVGRLAPEEVEVVLGTAEVRATFKVPRIGLVAGCYVTEGEILRNARARLLRDGIVVFDGVVGSLRRFKDDVRSVASGFECGIGLAGYNDVKEGDIIEAYQVREVARD